MSKLPIASFEDLPDEIILQIFNLLEFYDNASASQVCVRWKLLSEDQSIWQKINLSGRQVPAKFVRKALRHGCQYLRLCGTKIMNVPRPNVFSVSNQLKYLSISCDSTDKHHDFLMENLLGATQLLEKLSINCDGEYFQPNILQNKKTLTVLRICALKSLTIETVKLIFINCLELTEVSLKNCSMSVEALTFFCNNLTSKIKKLSLCDISTFDSGDYILKDEHVIALINHCPKLEELDLGGSNISEVALTVIIEKLQNLVKLKLPDTSQIRFPKLLELGSMPNLKYLRVYVDVQHGDVDLFDFLFDYPLILFPEKKDELDREQPFIKALLKNLPHLKINQGRFEIAAPDPRFLFYEMLWEIQCKPTDDFYERTALVI